MKRLIILFVFLTVQLAFAQNALQSVQQAGVLRVGMEIGYAPFEMTNKEGKFVGFDVSIAEEISKRLGVKLELIDTPWDNILKDLVNGKYDIVMSGMTITSERKSIVDFSTPYFIGGQTLLVNKQKADQIKSFRDMNKPGIRIVTKQETVADNLVRNFFSKAQIILMNKPEDDIVAALIAGEADVFVYDFPYLAIAAQIHKESAVFLSTPFTYEPFGIAVKKGDGSLVNRLNDEINALKADGVYKKLYDYWFKGTDWEKEM
ncbi:MAG: transporter substrate-binding domain-containing protein [Deferribacteraceae bacterium]|jgi:polar amino acid transport system substrate-binding protein|nr:transporter substrate-binding domain-containing protein [Deferribacteraceae bacterium]